MEEEIRNHPFPVNFDKSCSVLGYAHVRAEKNLLTYVGLIARSPEGRI